MTTIEINKGNGWRFDVVDYIKKLRNAGVSQEVAEIQAQELEHVLELAIITSKEDFHSKELATKKDLDNSNLVLQKDLANTKLVLQQDLANTKLELQKEIVELRYATLKFVVWTGCSLAAIVIGAVYTMLKLMLH